MNVPCQTCLGYLSGADVLSGASTCIECERRPLDRLLREALTRKHVGQARASAARPDDRARVEAAIRQLAATGRPFSANSCREIHGVKGGVVGAVFTALKNEGVIRPCGDETSTDAGTHGHRIYRWVGTTSAVAA